jgi:hypothetical protein
MLLDLERIAAFRRDGFLHVREFLSPADVERLRAALLAYFGAKAGESPVSFRRELDVGKRIPAVQWLVTHPPSLDLGRQLLGDPVLYTFESAAHLGTGCRYWHKDARDAAKPQGSDWAADYRVVFFSYYLSDHVGQSGGLSLRRGSHAVKDLCGGELESLETGPGDLVIFDCRITHAGNTQRLKPAFRWIPRSLVMALPRRSGWRALPRLQRIAQVLLLKCSWLFLHAPPDRMAIFLAYGGDDAHTRGFFEWLRSSPGYEHLLAYAEPARLAGRGASEGPESGGRMPNRA